MESQHVLESVAEHSDDSSDETDNPICMFSSPHVRPARPSEGSGSIRSVGPYRCGDLISVRCDGSTADALGDTGISLSKCKCTVDTDKLERLLAEVFDRLRADLKRELHSFGSCLVQNQSNLQERDGAASPGALHRQTDSFGFGEVVQTKKEPKDNVLAESDDSCDMERMSTAVFGQHAAQAGARKQARSKRERTRRPPAVLRSAVVTRISEARPSSMRALNDAHFHGVMVPVVSERSQAWADGHKEANATPGQQSRSAENSDERDSSSCSEVKRIFTYARNDNSSLGIQRVVGTPPSRFTPSQFCTAWQQKVTTSEGIDAAQSDQVIHNDAFDDSISSSCKDALPELLSSEGERGIGNVHVPRRQVASSTSGSHCMDDLRKAREETIVEQTIKDESELRGVDHPVTGQSACFGRHLLVLPNILLTFSGILRSAAADKWDFVGMSVVLVSVLLCVSTMVNTWLALHCFYELLTESVFSLCVLAALVILRQHCDLLFGKGTRSLHLYASKHGFLTAWMYGSLRKFFIILFAWLISVMGHSWTEFYLSETSGPHLLGSTFTFALVAGLFSMQMYFILHICCCLKLMIDAFCVRFITEMSFSEGIDAWNAVQAIVHRSAGVVELGFFLLQTSIVVALAGSTMEMVAANWNGDVELTRAAILRFLGWLPMTSLVLYCLFEAAEVTEKCRKVPAFVNSLIRTPEDTINVERQFMVDFILQGDAGFYMFGIRLTVFMVFKCSYLLLLMSLSVVSQWRAPDEA